MASDIETLNVFGFFIMRHVDHDGIKRKRIGSMFDHLWVLAVIQMNGYRYACCFRCEGCCMYKQAIAE